VDIQIIRDTVKRGKVQDSVTKWHKGEGGRGFAKVSRDIFSKMLSLFTHLGLLSMIVILGHCFGKIKMSRHTGGGAGGYGGMQHNDTWEGSTICQKSATYFLNGPLEVKF
jgi:hypothetical protein